MNNNNQLIMYDPKREPKRFGYFLNFIIHLIKYYHNAGNQKLCKAVSLDLHLFRMWNIH